MYKVLQDNKAAITKNFPSHQSHRRIDFNENVFSTLDEAQEYANHWLGEHRPFLEDEVYPGNVVGLNKPYTFGEQKSVLEIKEV
jgi:hypothetical protein